jgi:hypothetical protein
MLAKHISLARWQFPGASSDQERIQHLLVLEELETAARKRFQLCLVD